MLTPMRTVPSENLWDTAKQYLLAVLDTQKWLKEHLQKSQQPRVHWESASAVRDLEVEYNRIFAACCQNRGFTIVDTVHPTLLVQYENVGKPDEAAPSQWALLPVDSEQAISVELFPTEFQNVFGDLVFRHTYNLNWFTHTQLSSPLTCSFYIEFPMKSDTILLCAQFRTCSELIDSETITQHAIKYGITIPKYPSRQIRALQEATLLDALCVLNLILVLEDRIYLVFQDEKPLYPSRITPDLMFFQEWPSYAAYVQALIEFLIKDTWSRKGILTLAPRE